MAGIALSKNKKLIKRKLNLSLFYTNYQQQFPSLFNEAIHKSE
jgi:hypothetical protein